MTRPRYLYAPYLAIKGMALLCFIAIVGPANAPPYLAYGAIGSILIAPLFAWLESLI